MHPAVLVVGNGTSNLLHSIIFPSVSKAVMKLKKVPVVVVGPTSVQFCGASDKLGKTEAWDGGCVLQVWTFLLCMQQCLSLCMHAPRESSSGAPMLPPITGPGTLTCNLPAVGTGACMRCMRPACSRMRLGRGHACG